MNDRFKTMAAPKTAKAMVMTPTYRSRQERSRKAYSRKGRAGWEV